MTAAAAVRERPILFSGPMVRAILDGSKTQTRRVMLPQPVEELGAIQWGSPRYDNGDGARYFHTRNISPSIMQCWIAACPYGAPGDRLWVRERHALVADGFQITPGVAYHADGAVRWGVEMADGLTVYNVEKPDVWKWRPSIHTRREHSRILLELTDVRVEQVQDISEEDAIAEGIRRSDDPGLRSWPFLGAEHPVKGTPKVFATATRAFQSLWDSLNAPRDYGWDVNPWVWVLSFRRVDQAEAAA